MNFLIRLLTRNYTKVSLFRVEFNLQKYWKNGKEGSCTLGLHPYLKDDEYIKENIKKISDYIRDNYDMESLVK